MFDHNYTNTILPSGRLTKRPSRIVLQNGVKYLVNIRRLEAYRNSVKKQPPS